MAEELKARELGVWYSGYLDINLSAGVERYRHCSEEAGRAKKAARSIKGAAMAIHAFFPQGTHCVALCTIVNGLLQVVATATLLRDNGGPCLVTALHAICDRVGAYQSHYFDHGLMALATNNERIVLAGKKWMCYDEHDVAILPLGAEEAEKLGGALDIAHAMESAALWLAYGFPQSSNKQKHRLRPLSLNLQRIVLYNPTFFPSASSIAPEKVFSLHYDPKKSFNAETFNQQYAPSPKGCSGGLVAGYHPKFGCWIPEGIIAEWHESSSALVATSIRSVFPAQ
ncbi:hypothetical protein GHV42_16560 [Xanthomonas oryzae pv. oryzicola]|uniref:hypothetical protein n=1 Tax=Xanthomonas oryzae TaxID=347 RepID=UPI00129B6BC9|nr:hypothetical protein [Xanthomonas oryzae]QGH66996.1 hypothetical protein GHV42_16560 [Xanthomonas oryzae pv. oryzicola]